MSNAVSRRPSPVLGAQPSALTDILKAVLRLPLAVLDLMIDWQQRSEERASMAQMSQHQRRDIGLTEEDLSEMASRLRWSRHI